MEWIEANKKLPPEGLRVLSINMKSMHPEYRIDYLVYIDDVPYIWACRLHDDTDNVTHWMPLPRLPGS